MKTRKSDIAMKNVSGLSFWIIIPAHNEEKRIPQVIRSVKNITKNIIIVDDGSKDKTSKIAKNENVIVLRHMVNLGKGAALKTGCDYAVRNGAKILVVMDADGQHKAEDVPRLVNTLKENNLDIVFGGRKWNQNMPVVFKIGNLFLSTMADGLFRMRVKDTQSGFRAFTSEAYKKIRWESSDYSMESEMISKVGKNHLKYREIPIQTIYLDKYKGTTIFNGVKIAFESLLWKLRR
jgi:glycosyltransferase involved in cell wall biosynthesis